MIRPLSHVRPFVVIPHADSAPVSIIFSICEGFRVFRPSRNCPHKRYYSFLTIHNLRPRPFCSCGTCVSLCIIQCDSCGIESVVFYPISSNKADSSKNPKTIISVLAPLQKPSARGDPMRPSSGGRVGLLRGVPATDTSSHLLFDAI